jgi:serine/threonine protein kinase
MIRKVSGETMVLPAGTRLNEFEVLSLLGAGGMGEVYRARDMKLGREVAVKILPEDLAQDKERIGRFEREGKLLAQLNHPGIATLHGVAEDGGRILLVMELVEGETLADRIARGPIPWKEAEPLFHQIAEALEAAHEKGILHRDLNSRPPSGEPDGTKPRRPRRELVRRAFAARAAVTWYGILTVQ